MSGRDDGIGLLRDLSRKQPIDWLVVDHYELDARWEGLASELVRQTLVIDDLANRPHICDALLDQNVSNSLQSKYAQLTPVACKRWIGPSYLLARPGFYRPRANSGVGLLVFLGGGDHRQQLSRLLSMLAHLKMNDGIRLMITEAYGSQNFWQRRLGTAGRVDKDLHDTADLCRSVRGAVIRCGFIAYELSLLGVPMVIIHGTPIQREVARNLESMGYGIALDEKYMFDDTKMNDSLGRMSALKPVPMSSLHSSGSHRIAQMMESFND
jgi:UDP-2,4-diacetamido-2,4,6-trideoxy-beta-L-altropyranose hydrolase